MMHWLFSLISCERANQIAVLLAQNSLLIGQTAFSSVCLIPRRSAVVVVSWSCLRLRPPPAAAVWMSWTGRWPPPPPPPRLPPPLAHPPPPPGPRWSLVAPRRRRRSQSGSSRTPGGWNTSWPFPETSYASLRGRSQSQIQSDSQPRLHFYLSLYDVNIFRCLFPSFSLKGY